MSRLIAALLVLVVSAPAAPQSSSGDLQAGIALVKEGDFEGAVLKLDGAIRALEADPRDGKDLATAYLYLGVAYLELDQQGSARVRFQQALGRDPSMRLDPRQFSPQVIRTFEAVRGQTPSAPAPQPSPAAARPAGTAPPGSE